MIVIDNGFKLVDHNTHLAVTVELPRNTIIERDIDIIFI